MEEIWKDIEGYKGLYQVSNLGRVRSLDRRVIRPDGSIMSFRGRMLKQGLTPKFYLKVYPSKRSKKESLQVHRLVALSFIPNPENKSDVNHIDGNKQNNNVKNLEWATALENQLHAYKNGLKHAKHGESNGMHKLKEPQVLWIREHYIPRSREFGQRALGGKFGIDKSIIRDITNRKTWKHI